MRFTHDSRQWQSLMMKLPLPAARLPGRNARRKAPRPIPKSQRWETTAHTGRDEMNIEAIQPSGAYKPTGATAPMRKACGSPAHRGRPATTTNIYTPCTACPSATSTAPMQGPQQAARRPSRPVLTTRTCLPPQSLSCVMGGTQVWWFEGSKFAL